MWFIFHPRKYDSFPFDFNPQSVCSSKFQRTDVRSSKYRRTNGNLREGIFPEHRTPPSLVDTDKRISSPEEPRLSTNWFIFFRARFVFIAPHPSGHHRPDHRLLIKIFSDEKDGKQTRINMWVAHFIIESEIFILTKGLVPLFFLTFDVTAPYFCIARIASTQLRSIVPR